MENNTKEYDYFNNINTLTNNGMDRVNDAKIVLCNNNTNI